MATIIAEVGNRCYRYTTFEHITMLVTERMRGDEATVTLKQRSNQMWGSSFISWRHKWHRI